MEIGIPITTVVETALILLALIAAWAVIVRVIFRTLAKKTKIKRIACLLVAVTVSTTLIGFLASKTVEIKKPEGVEIPYSLNLKGLMLDYINEE